MLISYLLNPIAACFHRRGKYSDHTYYEWISNSSLQLQRLAHQGVGAGTWTGSTGEILTTKAGDKLAVLDFSDPAMPLLKNLESGSAEKDRNFTFISQSVDLYYVHRLDAKTPIEETMRVLKELKRCVRVSLSVVECDLLIIHWRGQDQGHRHLGVFFGHPPTG